MVRVESPPTDRESPFFRALLAPVLLMAAATAAAFVVVPAAARIPVVWFGLVATVVVTAVAAEVVRRGRAMRALRAEYGQRLAFLEQRVAGHDRQTLRTSNELLPAAIRRLRAGHSPNEVMRDVVDADPTYRGLPDPQRALVRTVLDIIDNEEAMRDSAQRAFVNIARRVQAIVHQQSTELRNMEEDHGRNPDVFDDLLRIDHGTSLIGRLADSIAVLGGGRPGRQWPEPVPLYSVLRGAMSRILEYPRVELHSIAQVAIIGTAVEPLIHACAELLDNATRYSPPQTKVHVTAVEVQSGIAIEIEDGGVSLSEEARSRAENMLARAQAGMDLNDLGETPRLGMAVVGRLSKMYDLKVSLRQSAYGGVRAVLIVPRGVITTGRAPGLAHGIGITSVPKQGPSGLSSAEEERVPRRKKPRKTQGPQRTAPASFSMEDDVPEVTEWTANGLPQRRSRGRAPLFSHVVPADEQPTPPSNGHANGKAKEPGIWLEAFTNGYKGTTPDPSADDEPDEALDKGDLK
ncbi:ATP-binding protein [Streptomyces sp. NPDC002994]|uniref:sensor histidine kinase n=1 Tax=Streptomyces sp. NPDC002994 TaxID=3154441 RepID=UPI0033BE4893